MKLIAIDPGSHKTGYCFRGADGKLVSGVFRAPAAWPAEKRIAKIADEFRLLLISFFTMSQTAMIKEGITSPPSIFTHLLIETASNKTYDRQRGYKAPKNIAAMHVLGGACYVLIHTAMGKGLKVEKATDQEWIGGRKKELRQQQALYILRESGVMVPEDKLDEDKKYGIILKDDNEADAICLHFWKGD